MSGISFSASALDRVSACNASEALPQARRTTSYAKRGTAVHNFLSAASAMGREAALAQVAEKYRADCAVIDLDVLPAAKPDDYASEVAFAYDIDTGVGRELGRNLDRAYADLGPREVPGTSDVAGLTADAVVILDYKGPHATLGPAGESRQLKLLAVAARSAYGKSRAVVALVRLREDGTPWFDWAELDEFALAGFEEELRELVAKVDAAKATRARGEDLVTVEGDHCLYCPAFDFCPSKMSLVRAFAAAPDAMKVDIEGATEEQLALAWDRAKALEKVLERVLETLKARAKVRPIPFPNGQVLAPMPMEEVVPEVASFVLEALYGAEVAEAAVKTVRETTKTSIEKALVTHVLKAGMKITHLKNATFDAIREADGMLPASMMKKHKPKEPALEDQPQLAPANDASAELKKMLADGEAKFREATGEG